VPLGICPRPLFSDLCDRSEVDNEGPTAMFVISVFGGNLAELRNILMLGKGQKHMAFE
jgi:hypothetical protein